MTEPAPPKLEVMIGILRSMGLVLDQVRHQRVRIAMPLYQCDVNLDEELLMSPESSSGPHLIKEFGRARCELFGRTIDHIAKHDRSPVDRLAQIEDLTLSLIKAIKLAGFVPLEIAAPAAELEVLLREKPGSPSWSRAGYGAYP